MKPVRRNIAIPQPAPRSHPVVIHSPHPAPRRQATCADDGGLSLSIGDRVTLADHVEKKPPFPCGYVDDIKYDMGGCLVKHDDGNVYGWAFSELVKMADDWM